MDDTIVIKGISQGILATLDPSVQWGTVLGELTTHIEQRAAFFKGAQLVVDIGDRALASDELETLNQSLDALNVQLVALLSEDDATLTIAETIGLNTDLRDVEPPSRPTRPTEPPPETEVDSEEYGTGGVLIKRTLRNGRTIRSGGHVVVIGDVNQGAEIIAAGDIVVWGKLRGVVHAGANGDEEAVICALDLNPTQIRIAGLISISPQDTKKRRNVIPETAQITDGHIEAIPWNTESKGY